MSLPNFTLPKDHTFEWSVKVWVPIDGEKKPAKFTAVFKHVSPQRRLEILETFRDIQKARAEDILDERPADQDEETEATPKHRDHLTFEADLMMEVMVGWKDNLRNEMGEPLEFSPEHRQRLLEFDPARTACMEAYMRALNGRVPEKNSSRRRKPGPKA